MQLFRPKWQVGLPRGIVHFRDRTACIVVIEFRNGINLFYGIFFILLHQIVKKNIKSECYKVSVGLFYAYSITNTHNYICIYHIYVDLPNTFV